MKTITQKDFRDLYPAPDATKIQEMRRTLAALPDRNQEMPESRENRPVLRKRRVAFILAAALMLIGITALAVGLFSGTVVGWGETPRPFSEEELHLPPQEEMDRVGNYLSSCPDDMLTAVIWKDGSHSTFKDVQAVAESQEELLRILDAAGFPYPENLVPDGWTFIGALVQYGCAPDACYELVSEEEFGNGSYTAETYRLNEKDRILTGYTIEIEKGSKQGRISVGASTKELVTGMNIVYPVEDGVEARLVSVPGMEEAMFTAYNDHTDIQMYRSLETPVAVNVNWSSPDRDVWTYDRLSFDFTNVSLEEVVRYFSGTP